MTFRRLTGIGKFLIAISLCCALIFLALAFIVSSDQDRWLSVVAAIVWLMSALYIALRSEASGDR